MPHRCYAGVWKWPNARDRPGGLSYLGVRWSRMRARALCLAAALSLCLEAAAADVRVWQDVLTLPTYQEGPPNPNPPFDQFAAARFNYPYTLRESITDRRVDTAWRALVNLFESAQPEDLVRLLGHNRADVLQAFVGGSDNQHAKLRLAEELWKLTRQRQLQIRLDLLLPNAKRLRAQVRLDKHRARCAVNRSEERR